MELRVYATESRQGSYLILLFSVKAFYANLRENLPHFCPKKEYLFAVSKQHLRHVSLSRDVAA